MSFERRPELPGIPSTTTAPLVGLGEPKPADPEADAAKRQASRTLAVATLISLLVQGLAAVVAYLVGRAWGPQAFQATMFLSFGLGGLIALSTSSYLLRPRLVSRRAILKRSVLTSAVVASIETKGTKGKDGYVETPVLRYPGPDGIERVARAKMAKAKLTVGQSLTARYDPEDPEWVVVDGWDPLGLRFVTGFVAALMLAAVVMTVIGAVFVARL